MMSDTTATMIVTDGPFASELTLEFAGFMTLFTIGQRVRHVVADTVGTVTAVQWTEPRSSLLPRREWIAMRGDDGLRYASRSESFAAEEVAQ